MFVFRKFWRALLSSNTRFEIRPFALLPTILENKGKRKPVFSNILRGWFVSFASLEIMDTKDQKQEDMLNTLHIMSSEFH